MALKNQYYIMRHGESQANIEGIIVSNPKIGTVQYGLTDKGREDVRKSGVKSNLKDFLDIIYSSDFLRTIETGEIISEICNGIEIVRTPLLRERYFGNFDGTADSNYEKVWEKDEFDSGSRPNDSESTLEVKDRIVKLFHFIEKKENNKNILLVAHGDILQIMKRVIKNMDPGKHRKENHITQAEIIKLIPDLSFKI